MSLSGRVLSELKQGHWTAGTIVPAFQRRLLTALQQSTSAKNLSELCLGHYGKSHLDLISISSQKRVMSLEDLSAKAQALISDLFVGDYPNSSLISFEGELARTLVEAFKIIEATAPDLAAHMDKHITGFVQVRGVDFRSASHPHIFGIILLGDRSKVLSPQELSVSIVHEFAHQELFLINLLDRLVNQPFDFNEVHAPFQGKKRPPIGRLHSLWALYRMIQLQKAMGTVSEKYEVLLNQNVEAFEGGELTPFGIELVEIARKRAC